LRESGCKHTLSLLVKKELDENIVSPKISITTVHGLGFGVNKPTKTYPVKTKCKN